VDRGQVALRSTPHRCDIVDVGDDRHSGGEAGGGEESAVVDDGGDPAVLFHEDPSELSVDRSPSDAEVVDAVGDDPSDGRGEGGRDLSAGQRRSWFGDDDGRVGVVGGEGEGESRR